MNDAVKEWCKAIWRDEGLFVTLGCTRAAEDSWPLIVRTLKPRDVASVIQNNDMQRTWYAKYAMMSHELPADYPPQAKDAAGGYVLWADIDGYKSEYRAPLPLEPTFVIKTSPSGFHFGWVLKEFTNPRSLQMYNRAIGQQWTHSDSVHDPARWMKPPWGWNYKPEHGRPFPTHLTHFTDTWYKRSDFINAGLQIAQVPQHSGQQQQTDEWFPGVEIPIADIDARYNLEANRLLWARLHTEAPDGRRHREIYYMVSQLVRRGATRDEVYWRLRATPTVQSKFWWGQDAHLYARNPELYYLQDIRETYARLSQEYEAQQAVTVHVRNHLSA